MFKYFFIILFTHFMLYIISFYITCKINIFVGGPARKLYRFLYIPLTPTSIPLGVCVYVYHIHIFYMYGIWESRHSSAFVSFIPGLQAESLGGSATPSLFGTLRLNTCDAFQIFTHFRGISNF